MTAEVYPKSRREAVFLVSADFLIELCKGVGPRMARIVANALPADARIVRIGHDPQSAWLRVVLSSETFAPVPFDEHLPELPVTLFEVSRHEDLAAEGDR